MDKNIEYTQMAKYYDLFYARKNYDKEVEFIRHFAKEGKCSILDAGCGTGNHAKILKDCGFQVFGFDLSEEMIKIASEKLGNTFENGNILNYHSDKRYDIVISFFAVFNHLKTYKEFEIALKNLMGLLNESGVLIIDLHNPSKNGKKLDRYEDVVREMSWKINRLLNVEKTKIVYKINNDTYTTTHNFKIFKLNKLKKICSGLNLKYEFYENYNIKTLATNTSKNIQLVIYNS